MAEKPFTNKPDEKMEKMADAASHVLSAIKALSEAQTYAEYWSEHGTLGHFRMQLEEFMSCDNNEAGFEPYMEKVSDDVFRGRRNPVRDAKGMALKYSRFNRKGKAVTITVPED